MASLASTTMNTAPVSTEELLTKSAKKPSLSPEDDTIFIEKNTSQLGYERVWENKAQFNIESNGTMNTLEVQHESYGMRAQTAYICLAFEITLTGSKTDCACPANAFGITAFQSIRQRIGLNQMEIYSPNDHYIHKFIDIVNSNYSTQDRLNVLSSFGCFLHLDLSQAKHRLLLAKAYGFNFTEAANQTITRNVNLILPLTILHRMFNHNTILPVGTRIDFQFNCETDNKNCIVNGALPNQIGAFKFIPTQSYLFAQYPERDPAIMLTQLENREYVSEGLDYETFRIEIPENTTYISIPLARPGSKLPVKIDFAMIAANVLNSNKDIFQFKNFGISEVEVNYNGPFPSVHKLGTITGGPAISWETASTDSIPSLENYPLFKELLNQTDTLLLDKYGESYNNESSLSVMLRANPYMYVLGKSEYSPPSEEVMSSVCKLADNRQVMTMILMPSKIMDGSAYPTVQGSLDMNIKFGTALKQTTILYVNMYNYQQVTLNENHTCDIRNITLNNFSGRGTGPLGSGSLPPSTMYDDAVPVGEEDNIVPR